VGCPGTINRPANLAPTRRAVLACETGSVLGASSSMCEPSRQSTLYVAAQCDPRAERNVVSGRCRNGPRKVELHRERAEPFVGDEEGCALTVTADNGVAQVGTFGPNPPKTSRQ
jgi:hypothetical protein